ncbi:MAG: hypothetical protein GXP36_00175 [Actinobacteria bacterium]|nr:hypothetical protein [Actinomycetota bacterium]
METVLVAVDVPLVGDERHKNWAKVVENVDPSQSTGWAFEGEFVAAGGIQDVPVGSVLLVYGERGSRQSPHGEGRVFRVNGDGTLTLRGQASGRAWARTLRDEVAELLDEAYERPIEQKDWTPELMGFSDTALREELRRRNKGDE